MDPLSDPNYFGGRAGPSGSGAPSVVREPDDSIDEDELERYLEHGDDSGSDAIDPLSEPFGDDLSSGEREFLGETEPKRPLPPPRAPTVRHPKIGGPPAGKPADPESFLRIDFVRRTRAGPEARPRFILVIGPTASGKTTLISEIIRVNNSVFEQVYSFTKTLNPHAFPYDPRKDCPPRPADPKDLPRWQARVKAIQLQKAATPYGYLAPGYVHSVFTEADIKAIVAFQKARIAAGDITPMGPDGHRLIVIDDSIGAIKPNSPFWTEMATSGRHAKLTFLITSQKIAGCISTGMRSGTDTVFATRMMGEEKKAFYHLQSKYEDVGSLQQFLTSVDRTREQAKQASGQEQFMYLRSDRNDGKLECFRISGERKLWMRAR